MCAHIKPTSAAFRTGCATLLAHSASSSSAVYRPADRARAPGCDGARARAHASPAGSSTAPAGFFFRPPDAKALPGSAGSPVRYAPRLRRHVRAVTAPAPLTLATLAGRTRIDAMLAVGDRTRADDPGLPSLRDLPPGIALWSRQPDGLRAGGPRRRGARLRARAGAPAGCWRWRPHALGPIRSRGRRRLHLPPSSRTGRSWSQDARGVFSPVASGVRGSDGRSLYAGPAPVDAEPGSAPMGGPYARAGPRPDDGHRRLRRHRARDRSNGARSGCAWSPCAGARRRTRRSTRCSLPSRLHDLMAASDAVVVATPLTRAARPHRCEAIAAMKPTAVW